MKKFIVVFLLAIFSTISLTPTTALAQRRGYYRDTVYYTKADVERVIRRAEDQSDRFQKVLDRALDRSSLDGSNFEDRLNDQAKRLERALDDLRDDFDRARNYSDARFRVEKVLREASQLNSFVRKNNVSSEIRSSWNNLRQDLNLLADLYNLRRLR